MGDLRLGTKTMAAVMQEWRMQDWQEQFDRHSQSSDISRDFRSKPRSQLLLVVNEFYYEIEIEIDTW